jgi:hypothetical protein
MALNLREKRLLALPLLVGAGLAFYNYVHEPLFARRAEAASQFDKVSADLKKDQAKLTKEGNLAVRREAVAAREKVVDAWVPGKNSAALFIWYLSQAELHSGAHIKGITVGERKQVTAAPQQGGAQGQTPPPAQPQQNQQPQQSQPQPNQQAPQGDPDAAPTLTVVELELKVDARFAQHLLFNQALEEMPLFLNTNALAMAKPDTSPVDQVNKLVESGNKWMAAQVLAASPTLDGSYKIALYFKGDKAGPTTEVEQFGSDAGRMDPFAMDGVDEFLNTLSQYYSGVSTPGTSADQYPYSQPMLPGEHKQQMG